MPALKGGTAPAAGIVPDIHYRRGNRSLGIVFRFNNANSARGDATSMPVAISGSRQAATREISCTNRLPFNAEKSARHLHDWEVACDLAIG